MQWKKPSDVLNTALKAASGDSLDTAEHQLCRRYYDGYQETSELKQWRTDRGIQPHMVNLFKEHADTVAGNEHQNQTDWQAVADDADGEEVAEASNVIINEMARLHDVNHHCSEAYLPMIISGIGWLYFGENDDPMGLEYDCHTVPSEEIIWDRRSRRLDLEDCQFLIRRRFLDKDEAKNLFPEHEALIDQSLDRSDNWGPIPGGQQGKCGSIWSGVDTGRYSSYLYRKGDRPQVAVFDMYYRAYEKRTILYMDNSPVKVEFDPENEAHLDAINSGNGRTKRRRIKVMRNAWFIGPHLVSDELSPHPHRMYPYALCRGHQETSSRAVYGIGRQMLGPQDSYNMALAQYHVLLEKVTVIVKGNALSGTDMTVEDVQKEVHKPDGVIEISTGGDIQIIHHYQHLRELQSMMAIARDNMKAATGINGAFTGQQEGQKSGIAMQTLVEQAQVTLAELNSNHEFFRRMVGRLMLAHAVKKIGSNELPVSIKSESGEETKTVTLNERQEDGTISNSLTTARMQIAMKDIQTSAGYRAQNMMMLQQTAAAAPEAIQGSLFIGMLEASNLPNRHALIADLRRSLGKGQTEEEQQQMMESQAQAAAAEADLDKREREAKIALDNAKAEEAIAKAEEHRANLNTPAEGQSAVGDPQDQAANDAEMELKKQKMAKLRQVTAERAIA